MFDDVSRAGTEPAGRLQPIRHRAHKHIDLRRRHIIQLRQPPPRPAHRPKRDPLVQNQAILIPLLQLHQLRQIDHRAVLLENPLRHNKSTG